MSTAELVGIGVIAESSGIAVSAVRYYTEIGVITAAGRVGGKRRFDPDTVGRVSFIRRAREAGFSLEEIRTILDDQEGGWHDLVGAKLAELGQRRDRLDAMITMLGEIQECGCRAVALCPRMAPC